ncbi:hypothetical protein KAJ61_01450 [Candidatus Parcubacteria bacterium]|nr:hypothetical protein [Candidatus Parcubacteria bacterium]
MLNTKTTRLSSLLPTYLVEEVKKVSTEEKITQSLVIKKALELWFNNKLDRDTKALAKINFDDLPSEDDWNLIQSDIK